MAGLWSVLKCGSDTRGCGMLPSCGRAPVCALYSGHGGSGSMVGRGSARCTGSSGLGDTAAFIPAGGGDGPGGALRLPDRATVQRCAEPVRSVFEVLLASPNRLKIDPLVRG